MLPQRTLRRPTSAFNCAETRRVLGHAGFDGVRSWFSTGQPVEQVGGPVIGVLPLCGGETGFAGRELFALTGPLVVFVQQCLDGVLGHVPFLRSR